MKRRGGSGKPRKRRRTDKAEARKALTARTSVADLLEQLAQRTRERDESLEQLAATSEVLRAIARSPVELKPVFEAMLANATKLCEASYGNMWLCEGDNLRTAALHGPLPAAYVEFLEQWRSGTSLHPGPELASMRAVNTRQTIQVADLRGSQAYLDGEPVALAGVEVAGIRTLLAVPLLKENEPVGVIAVYRKEVRPFTDKQIELVQNFASQAVIAIENTRLLSELRQRTNDLSESLDQQTATSEVLKVISSSPGELEPVFNAMLANATRLCEATFGSMLLTEGSMFRRVAIHNAPPMFAEFHRKTPVIQPQRVPDLKLLLETKRPVHIADAAAMDTDSPIVKYAGARTVLVVPMLNDGDLVGAIAIYRQEVRPFTDKQIGLVANFAAQAVIAIENTRLLSELRESLQQQTATADVLKVISRSTFDLRTVLNTLVESSASLCEAYDSTIWQPDGGRLLLLAHYGPISVESLPIIRGTAAGRTFLDGRTIHIADLQKEAKEYPESSENARRWGFHAIVCVPLMREGVAIGVIALRRIEPQLFTERQVALLQTFADQAVIAIENVRLFNNVEARTRELAASLESLRTTQDRLVQTQKLALLGQLTAGIAHEIKNPLNFVNNFSGISAELIDELQDTLRGIPLDDKARTEIIELTDTLKSNFDKVVHHGRRADTIVKNMLQHSRDGSGDHRAIDINALVEESLNLAWHGARAEKQGFEIKLKQSFDPSAGEIDVFPQDIRRALLNLIANGFYAATRRRAETNGGDYEPTLTALTKDLGDRVEIRLRDNGTGMTPDVKEKMFNPFFTTKPTGEGTGLGLSISHDIIVKQHGGAIEVDTQLGEFTEITVILPRTAALLPERS
jgi:signal transduction histidine kinase